MLSQNSELNSLSFWLALHLLMLGTFPSQKHLCPMQLLRVCYCADIFRAGHFLMCGQARTSGIYTKKMVTTTNAKFMNCIINALRKEA